MLTKKRLLDIGRMIAALSFILAGANHFRSPAFYREIVPPGFGPPAFMVIISGIAEIAGGIGLLIPSLRRAAGWGLIALLIAVFPANIYMAIEPSRFPRFPDWTLWARLPLQIVFIFWIWCVSLSKQAE
ncbi:MAG TPA: MauE/DoxX family redox-associated membrane protein [Tepidisphaeraceae bacterium]|jgi:uncharacterized membrane protein